MHTLAQYGQANPAFLDGMARLVKMMETWNEEHIGHVELDEQAQAFGHSLRREIGFLTVHSMFHLLGYDHEEGLEAVRMREKEETVLSRLGLVRDASYVMEE